MTEIAKKFVQVKKDRFGNMWALTKLENLAACCDMEAKRTCKEGQVMLCCSPKETTESSQMIDAGHGRSMRCDVGRVLDE